LFFSGLLAGSLHVVSGPDHVAAIAPLSLRTPKGGSALGAVWGLGHGGGVALWVAGAALLRAGWGYELPSAVLEAVVGVALMALGVVSYRRASARESATEHGSALAHEARAHGRGRVAAFVMGALHGSAGATHLLALLPTLGLPTRGAVAYAAGYLLAGVLAMASVGSVIGRLSARFPDLTHVRRVCALSVLTLGTAWLASAIADLT
jgi:hypothetical protein